MEEARARDVGRLSLAVGIVAVGSAVCLATYFAVGGPLGTINDIGNALTAILSAVLAWRLRSLIPGRVGDAAVAAAAVGSAVVVAGSALVMSGATGFFLAGLVASLGFAGIGAWLVALNRSERVATWPRALRWVGIAAGALMALGIIAVPGLMLRLDDMASAPAWVWLAELGWLGIYLVYPIWAIWLGLTGLRRAHPAAVSVEESGLSA